MREKYTAAFIIPLNSSKVLSEDGWEFITSNRLTSRIKEFLIDALKLRFLESYLGIEVYVSETIKMSVSYDGEHSIENIYFQLHGKALTTLPKVFLKSPISKQAELFIP
jgi:hypothetical protein